MSAVSSASGTPVMSKPVVTAALRDIADREKP
jgi:hypothetical protein